ncbi:MAG TPA: hypothetical protein VMB81_09605 [Candidatus Sulfotelmatobacter sp.]|nr:hypothetical protein [Candidatus Sulfotelmatobacter sp.]
MARIARYVLWIAVAGQLLGATACKNVSVQPVSWHGEDSYIPFSRD